jgi:predicted nucleic acid-binding protein
MPLNYTVQAQVIDIRYDIPKKEDIFLVDSNVWYWDAYTKATYSARAYQITEYPFYIKKAKSAQSLLLYSGLSLAELAHNIEQIERQFFSSTLKPKEYRHNYPTERTKVVAEVQNVWDNVTSTAVCTDLLIDEVISNTALTRFQTQLLDGYDLLILEAMDKAGVKQIITDDGDYVTVPGIRVFTANWGAIAAARSQGKLLIR